MAMASRLNTLHRLETSHVHSSRHYRIIQNVSRHCRHLWRINDVNVGFLCNFAIFNYGQCQIERRNFLFSSRICVLIESDNFQSLMCNPLGIVDSLRQSIILSSRPVLNGILLIQHVLFLRSSRNIYQDVRSVKRIRLQKFGNNFISIDAVMTSIIFWYDVKIWWRHISIKNVKRAFQLCYLVVVIIIFVSFHAIRSWFTDIPSFIDVSLRRTKKEMVSKVH